jgi:hypothetical protein
MYIFQTVDSPISTHLLAGELFLDLTHAQKKRVKAAIKFSRLLENVEKMNYDAIVTSASFLEMFIYDIPKGKVKLKRRQSKKKTKIVGPSQLPVPRVSPMKRTSRKKVRAKRIAPKVSFLNVIFSRSPAPAVNKTPSRSPGASHPPPTSRPTLGLSRVPESSLPPETVVEGLPKPASRKTAQ